MSEDVSLLRIFAAFLLVVGLILAFSWAMRKLRNSRFANHVQGNRRMHIVEQLYLDSRRRMVIVKQDDKEHVLLLGPHREQVVETR